MKIIHHLEELCQGKKKSIQKTPNQNSIEEIYLFLEEDNKIRMSFQIQLDFHLNRKTSAT